MAGYHLFSTGEVLSAANVNDYLMKQTVMIFASASARTTALSGVVREGMVSYRTDSHITEYYNGSAWVTLGSTLTTKGDIQVYDTAPNRLSTTPSTSTTPLTVTSSTQGYSLVQDQVPGVGLNWTDGNPIPNPVLNSSFDIWQRNTSVAVAASTNGYTADRWNLAAGANQASTVSRQATGDTTNLPNIQYCVRVQRNSGQTGTATMYFQNSFESLNSIAYAGKAVTLSFYARAGANYSPSGSTLYGYVVSGTGTDQGLQGGYTGAAFPVTATATLTTTWQRFTATGTVSASATEIGLQFQWIPTGTAGANDYFEVTGVQLDRGSVALPFRRNGSTLQGELAACQRYYTRFNNPSAATSMGIGMAINTTGVYGTVALPTAMRVVPTSLDFANLQVGDGVTYTAVSTCTLSSANPNGGSIALGVASGLTQFRPYLIQTTGASGYLGFNAEL